MKHLLAVGAIAAALLASPAQCQDSKADPVITVTINQLADGAVTQTVSVGAGPFVFLSVIGDQIVSLVPFDRPIDVVSVGSASDQRVADQYATFFKSMGYNLRGRSHSASTSSPPSGPITITVYPDYTQVLIVPAS
jgi:hypothetical protein